MSSKAVSLVLLGATPCPGLAGLAGLSGIPRLLGAGRAGGAALSGALFLNQAARFELLGLDLRVKISQMYRMRFGIFPGVQASVTTLSKPQHGAGSTQVIIHGNKL